MTAPAWEVIHGDCLDVMRGMPDASVDAIVTDPPYFRVKGEAWDRQWDDEAAFLGWLGTVADEWRRVLRANGSLYVFASPQLAARVEVEVVAPRFRALNSIRWYKEAGWHQKAERETLRSFLTPWEAIIFAEQRHEQYADAALALHKQVYAPIGRIVQTRREAAGLQRWQVDEACAPSRKPTGLCYRWEEGACLPTLEQWVAFSRLCGDPREYEELRREYEELRREYEELRREYEELRREYEELRRPFNLSPRDRGDDLWRFTPVMGYEGKHPCEKPVALLAHILRCSTKPGAVVLDTFAGSGSTGVACVQEGRRFIGVEREAAYVEIARRRIADAAAQTTLFTGDAA